MEKNINSNSDKLNIDNIYLKNRKNITIEGIIEIISSNENEIITRLKDTNLLVSGSNIHITKLDIEEGLLCADGDFNMIKYGKTNNFFKRLFKWKFHMFYN